MFRVYDCGKPADCKHHLVHSSWAESEFSTYEEAVKYAREWLGIYDQGFAFELGKVYNYGGHSIGIEIREE